MANRTFVEKNYSLLKGLVRLYPIVKMTEATTAPILQKRTFTAFGTTATAPANSLAAAPTTGVGYAVGDGAGTASVARTGAGAWTIRLSDPYLYLVGLRIAQFYSATAISTVLGVGVDTTTDVTLNTSTGLGGSIDIILFDESGAADPGSIGDQFTFEIILANAGEP